MGMFVDGVRVENPFIHTTTGVEFDLLNPTPDMIALEDICVSLDNLKRFTGHGKRPWSVARHSLVVREIVADLVGDTDRKLQRTALLHDATEAYFGDISRPLKEAMRLLTWKQHGATAKSPADQIERKIWLALAEKFDLYKKMPKIVKVADTLALGLEADYNFGKGTAERWEIPTHDRTMTPSGAQLLAVVTEWL